MALILEIEDAEREKGWQTISGAKLLYIYTTPRVDGDETNGLVLGTNTIYYIILYLHGDAFARI